jgi:rubrerythrin
MKQMTEDNLEAAFAGESQAHLKYTNFAERAEKEGRPNVARLFHAAALSERIHASSHLRALGGIDDTLANLAVAIEGETFEVEEMYPAYTAGGSPGRDQGAAPMNWALSRSRPCRPVHAGAQGGVRRQGPGNLRSVGVHVLRVHDGG